VDLEESVVTMQNQHEPENIRYHYTTKCQVISYRTCMDLEVSGATIGSEEPVWTWKYQVLSETILESGATTHRTHQCIQNAGCECSTTREWLRHI
jgi:hypothetical protein